MRQASKRVPDSAEKTVRDIRRTAEPLFAPALADACQTRMMRQLFMQTVADEPADSDINLSLAHQFAIVDEPTSKPASINRTAASGSIAGRPSSRQ